MCPSGELTSALQTQLLSVSVFTCSQDCNNSATVTVQAVMSSHVYRYMQIFNHNQLACSIRMHCHKCYADHAFMTHAQTHSKTNLCNCNQEASIMAQRKSTATAVHADQTNTSHTQEQNRWQVTCMWSRQSHDNAAGGCQATEEEGGGAEGFGEAAVSAGRGGRGWRQAHGGRR